jgi:hypothetical protein
VITGIVASELDAMGQTSADGGVLLGRVVSQFACFLGVLIIQMAFLPRPTCQNAAAVAWGWRG